MSRWPPRPLADLNEILANLYSSETEARRVAAKAELNTARIDFGGSSLGRWFNILDHANALTKVDQIVLVVREENPDDESLKLAAQQTPPKPVKGPEARDWHGPTVAAQLEKIIGPKSTLVPISYLERGLMRAKAVTRVKHDDGSSGTGFVIRDNILITNNHVLPDAAAAKKAIIQFNYQQTEAGRDAPLEEVRLLSDTFRTSLPDDWSAVKIDGDAVGKWGALPLNREPVKVGDFVNIIQHPGGGQKQISVSANVIVFVGGGRIQYLTDTLPGSSGSPVFDTQWNVIALHHSGGWLTEPNSPSKTTYLRNEGITIDRIIDGLAGA